MQNREVWHNKQLVFFVVLIVGLSFFYQNPGFIGNVVSDVPKEKGQPVKVKETVAPVAVVEQPTTEQATTPQEQVVLEQPSGEQGSIHLEIDATIKNDKVEVTNVYTSCAQTEEEKTMYDNFKLILRHSPSPGESDLPKEVEIHGKKASVRWHRGTTLYAKGYEPEQEEEIFKGYVFLDAAHCGGINENTLAFSNDFPIKKVVNAEVFSESSLDGGGTCQVLWERTASVPQNQRATYVFVTDQGYQNFLDGLGSGGWIGDPITQQQEDDALDYMVHSLLEVPPFSNYQTKIDVLNYRSDTKYSECVTSGICNFGQVRADLLNTYASSAECSYLGVIQNLKFMVYHGVDASYNTGILGKAYFNSDSGVNYFGAISSFALAFANNLGYTITREEMYQWRLNELIAAMPTTIHEYGHTYGLDHTSCDFTGSGGGSPPWNSVLNFCFTSMTACDNAMQLITPSLTAAQRTNECELLTSTGPKAVTVTRGEKNVGEWHNYMSPGLSGSSSPIHAAGYQQIGRYHAEYIHDDVLSNRFGMTKEITCGDSQVDQGEDVDNSAPLYRYDRDRDAVNYCVYMEDSLDYEMNDRYPNTLPGTSNYKTMTFSPPFTPFNSGVVTKNRDSCRLYYRCSRIPYPGPVSGLGPHFKFGDDYSHDLGFVPSSVQTDCSYVDYRFDPGKQSTTFNNPSNRAQPTCDFNSNFQKNSPFLPEEDETIFYAFRKDDQNTGTKTFETGILDLLGNMIKQSSIPYPTGIGNLLELKYIQFHPSDWSHNYDPTNQPDTAFSEFRHPIGLFAVFDDHIYVYRFKTNLLDGIDPTPFRTYTIPGIVSKSVDISFNPSSRQVILSYFVKPSTGGEEAHQVKMPTLGTTQPQINPTAVLTNIGPQGQLVFYNHGVSPDKKAFVAIKDAQIPSGGLSFIQQTQNSPSTVSYRTLTPETHFLRGTVTAKTNVAHDAFGRYTFSTVENDTPSAPLTFHHYTLTSEGIRHNLAYPVTGLIYPRSSYETFTIEPVQTKESIVGPIMAAAIFGDDVIAVADEDGQVDLLPSEVPNMIAFPHEPFFALDAIETITYSNVKPNFPLDLHAKPILLTTVPDTYFPAIYHNRARLYIENSGSYTPIDLDTAWADNIDYRHFAVLASGVGRVPTPPTSTVIPGGPGGPLLTEAAIPRRITGGKDIERDGPLPPPPQPGSELPFVPGEGE